MLDSGRVREVGVRLMKTIDDSSTARVVCLHRLTMTMTMTSMNMTITSKVTMTLRVTVTVTVTLTSTARV